MDSMLAMFGRLIFYFLATCFTTYLTFREHRNRNALHNKKNTNIYQKMLNIWSMITMILTVGNCIGWLIGAIPSMICGFSYTFGTTCFFNTRFPLLFYQISRLQYCFVHLKNTKYGYPKWIFYILYSWCTCIAVYSTIFSWFSVSFKRSKYLCLLQFTQYFNIIVKTALPAFYLADWTVLSLYIIKSIQLKRLIDLKNNDINIVLHKILFLTIWLELMIGIIGIMSLLPQFETYSWTFIYLDPCLQCLAVYLMIEHNNDSYVKIVSILYQLKICCCCHCLMKDTVEKQQNNIHQHTRNVQKKHISQPKIQQDVIQISVKTEANKSHNSVNDSVNQIIDSDCDVTIYTETIADALPSQNEGSNYLTSSKHNILPETHSRGNSKQILPPLLTIPENGKSVDNQLTECKLMECTHLQRLKNTLDKMNEKCIAVSELLDDYNHLLFNHNDDEQFEIILNMFGYCNIITCNTFIRHHQYRNRKYEQLEPNEVATQQIIDKIHCFYYHSFDLGNRLTIKEQIDLKDNTLDDSLKTNNKYVKLHQILSDKRKLRRNVNAINVDERLNNRYNQLQIINSAQEHNVNKYCFGCEFSYDGTGEELENKEMNQELNMKLIVIPKYSSFKNELLMNEIAQLTIAEFDTEYNKCIHHFTTI
eukprot:88752_1